MTIARKLLVSPFDPGFYHCVSRCVRRAWLCGLDPLSGQSFDHRRQWIEDRLIELAEIFAVGLYAYAVMSNHFHVVLRLDPTAPAGWDDDEVADRWCRLYPARDADPRAQALRREHLLANSERLAVCRERLGDLSWFMRCLNEPIARRANAEDDCTGRFWEGRYKCQALLDENAVLAAMTYVDLNPIRASMTTELAKSDHTTIQRRVVTAREAPTTSSHGLGAIAGRSAASLPLTVAQYIALVDYTGRQLRPDKRGRIPPHAPAALEAIHLPPDRWAVQVKAVGSGYWRAVGATQALLDKAAAMGQQWLKGIGLARVLDKPA